MITCNEIRDTLALQPAIDEPLIEAHLGQCEACKKYRRQHQSLDVLLRTELHWEAPAALTARLTALAAAPDIALLPATTPAEVARWPVAALAARQRPQGWFVTAVYVLTTAIVVLSLLVAWQVIGSLASQIEFGALLTQLLALPGQALAYLNRALPESRYAIDFFLRVRTQLMWLLLVAVLWAALDKADLRFSFRGRQITL